VSAAPKALTPHLAPAPVALRARCRALARQLVAAHRRWPIECPPRVPKGALDGVASSGLFSERGFGPGYIINLFSPSLLGSAVSNGHWTVAVGATDPMRRWIRRSATGSATGRLPVATLDTIEGTRVRRYVVPTGEDALYSGHVVYEWMRGRADVMVSVHDARNEPVARAITAALIRKQ
jgi:hypothetical protein